MFTITPVVRILIILNVVVALLSNFVVDLNDLFALRYIESPNFRPYQFMSYMFAHADFQSRTGVWHLVLNMFGILMFGPKLEEHWGSSRFTIFYLVCGVGAGVVHMGISYYEIHDMRMAAEAYISNPTPVNFSSFVKEYAPTSFSAMREGLIAFKNDPSNPAYIEATQQSVQQSWIQKVEFSKMVGASGALFGILMAFGMLYPNLDMYILFLPVPIKAKYLVLIFGAYELYSGLNRAAGDNVAHFAHLGGMLFAFILIKIWERTYPEH